LKRLESFGLNKPNEKSNSINYLNLDTILEKIKKEEQKNFRNSFTSLSALTTAFGVMVISGSKK
jgi:hypothetical protein